MVEPIEDKGIRLAWDGGTYGDGYTLVSREDVARVLPLSLWIDNKGYVRCSGATPYQYLHNFIMDHSDPARPVDHINEIRHDNRRTNLRILDKDHNTVRPWRFDDEEEARLHEDYAAGRLNPRQLHEALRKHRNKRKL